MSGYYVTRVLDSALAPDLKFTAVVLASFADDHGYKIWPAMGLVAYCRGLAERRVQYHVKDLRDMDILRVVKPATQWFPAHYWMNLDKLPTREPYRPPERQRELLRPPPASGVHSTAPPSGVHSTAPGVQPSAPDPSPDPSRTHTRTAYAREDSEVQPTAPLITNPSLPLLVPVRDPDHAAHSWCGRICVPRFLHKQFKKALGGPVKWRPKKLRAFYAETLAAIPSAQPIGAEPVKFWRSAFAARFGAAADTDRLTRREIDEATTIRTRAYGGCPHEPRCGSEADCVREIALARRVG